MSVTNSQRANQTTFNNAFLSRTADSTTSGKVGLQNADVVSGANITNIQREHNAHASFIGAAINGVYNLLPTWVSSFIGTSTDSLKSRIEAVIIKFRDTTANGGHSHNGTDGNGPKIDGSNLGSQVPISLGGTGQVTKTEAFDALAPTTTKGDLIVHNGTDNVREPIGTNGTVLIADSTQASGVRWGISSGGGAGLGAMEWYEGNGSPMRSDINNIPMYPFIDGGFENLYTIFKVPTSYVSGTQITLKAQVSCADSSGTLLLSSISTLYRPTDSVAADTNTYSSTNAAVSIVGANNTQEHTIDITNGSGQINGISVAAGQMIKISLFRGSDTATSDLYFFHGTAVISS